MRLSADEKDPGYLPWRALGDRRFSVEAYVDGDLVDGPITADDVEGIVEVYAKDQDGRIITRGDEALRRVLTGNVRIVVAGMRRVIIESPFAAPTPEGLAANIKYARRCVRDSLLRNESPIASHLLYTQHGILDDDLPEERQHGIDAGLAWRTVADASVVYVDRGISKGMMYGIQAAIDARVPVEYRRLDPTSKTREQHERADRKSA